MNADDLLRIQADEDAATEILAMLASPCVEHPTDPWRSPFALVAGNGTPRWNWG